MGTTALRQLLKSLCRNSQWKYAVFWKLKHQSQMILTWEDGYCDYPKPREPVESISDDIYFKGANEILSSSCETNRSDGGPGGYPIGLAVADMSALQYAMGEGVVGEVAYTGNHRWVLFDNIFTSEVNSELVPEYPDEWLLQFASGIKTNLLVPVLPHGVLQLGSLEAVAEDLAMVAYVKDRFNAIHNVAGNTVPFTSNREIQAQISSSTLMSGVLDSLDEPSVIINDPLKAEDLKAFDSIRLNKDELSTLNQVVPVSTVQDAIWESRKDLPEILGGANENKIGVPSNSLIGESTPLNQSINASQLKMLESELFGLSCLEELQAYSQLNTYNMGVFEESSNGMNPFSAGIKKRRIGDSNANDTGHKDVSSFLSFPMDCELHKALGPAFQRQTNGYICPSSFSVKDTCSSSSLNCNMDLFDGTTKSSRFAEGGDAEMEDVVANDSSCLDDTLSNGSDSLRSSTILSGQFAASLQLQSQSEASALVGDDSVPLRHFRSPFVARDRSAFTSSASVPFKSITSTLTDKEHLEKRKGSLQPRKGPKQCNVSKKKVRLGDDQRPRPRDRQMIQDRVKELRQIVPNSAKCSIDGLLELTIKHMLYLRSVTGRSEKLRQLAHREMADPIDRRSSETKNGSQNGSSWAFEFGNELQVCPIVVEDLEYPGHMLIEMLCNEHGLFLEIAQVIRDAELTILKGTMETRSNRSWAHFIVEGCKGYHRMDVFWPLMHLLQRKRKPFSSKI